MYVNTLMIQDMLADPEWAAALTPEDLRGLTLALLVLHDALRPFSGST